MPGKILDNWDADLHFKATVQLRVGQDPSQYLKYSVTNAIIYVCVCACVCV